MNTVIECPYCRQPISIVRRLAYGQEVLENVYCSHCKRSMDIGFEGLSNLPYLLAYYGQRKDFWNYDVVYMSGIRIKKNDEDKKLKAYEINYHESSIDAAINIYYQEQLVKVVKCAECGRFIQLNKKKERKDTYGLFCDYCARKLKFRYSYEFLSDFYDVEQASLKEETENQESKKQEENEMTVKSTIIGFVLECDDTYKIYNPNTNQLAVLSAADFKSLCLGEFPYRKVRANTLTDKEVVETLDGKVYYVADAKKNELFDFESGKIERSATITNLLVNTNCYVKYIPVLKQYCSFADVSAGNVDPRIAKMIEVISNDIQSGNATVENNKVAKMVRFLADPEYAELLDMEALTDMVMADPQAFMVMTQMTNMQMAKSIMATQGAIPLSVNTTVAPQEKTESDDSMKLEGEDDARYKERMTRLMEEAAKYGNYEAAARYQKALNSI